ncbi:MAG: PqqD family peptide modification chaperone [Gammaproteobacteria bacterium]|nr:PqqD family peptide modification chaperone [Gammaproteobacteria bacterium]
MESVFSPLWYKVSGLKPSLRVHTRLYRHMQRNKLWYVLLDKSTGRCFRFNPTAYYILTRMDGKLNVQEIWDAALVKLEDDAPTQDEIIQLLGKLHKNDLLQCDVPPDTLDLFRRTKQQHKQKWKKKLSNPLAICIPLFDPNKLLDSVMPLVRPLFSIWGGILWVSVVAMGFILALLNWGPLTDNIFDVVFTGQNVLLMWLIYPFVKAMHEFGHAFSVKMWGGEVHDTGILFLLFMPVPYVDASCASAFAQKRRRLLVGAEGMMVELFIASIALFVWLNVEPGLVSAIAFNIILIGGVSTLFFNANPLLRFDGYYMLADAIDIPNLAPRSNRYIGYLLQRYVYGVKEAKSPAASPDERGWLFSYAIAAFVYRMLIISGIIFIVANKFFIIGVLLAIWACIGMLIIPAFKMIFILLSSPLLRKKRVRAIISSLSFVTIMLGILVFAPVPLWTSAQGVIWMPEQSHMRAETDGFINKILVQPGTIVSKGQALIEIENPFLHPELEYLLQQRHEMRMRMEAEWNDRVKADILKQGLLALEAKILHLYEHKEGLIINSPETGRFIMPNSEDTLGRYVKQGDLLAYVVSDEVTRVRAVVPQEEIGLIRHYIDSITVQSVGHPGKTMYANIERVVPAGSEQLPSMALGSAGGGDIMVTAKDDKGVTAMQKVFQFELVLQNENDIHGGAEHIGSRVYVRFGHGSEPLAEQWFRSVRQLFLRRLNV